MIIYKKPNYQEAQEQAYQTIIKSKIKSLPINLKKIIKTFDNLHLQKYSAFAWENSFTIEEVCDFFNSDEGCLWRRDDNQYVIFYNDTITKKERVRFTIAHEIGHFVLKHHELSNKTSITRYSLTSTESEVLEKEANYFAKRLLTPIPIVYSFISLWDKISSDHLISIFDVSYSVSGFIMNELRRNQRYGISRINHDLELQFQDYIYNETHKFFCTQCKYVSIGRNYKYCSICDSNGLVHINYENYLTNKEFGDDYLIYSTIKIDEVSRATECPRCQNEKVKGHLCQICGAFLTNRCTGHTDHIFNDQYAMENSLWQNEKGCVDGSLLEGDARYCLHCGSISSFYAQGFLSDWHSEKKEAERELVLSEVAASLENEPPQLVAVPDEDLPF